MGPIFSRTDVLKRRGNGQFPGSLLVRIQAFTAETQVQSLVGALRSCKPLLLFSCSVVSDSL